MRRKSFLEQIEEEFEWLLSLGYTFKVVDTSIFFEKKEGNFDCCINFFWAEFNDIKIQGLFALKRFKIVEELIESKTGRLDYTIRLPLDYTKITSLDLSIETSSAGIYIRKKEDVKEFSDLVKCFFTEQAVTFFDQFLSLKDIEMWLNDHEVQEHSQLLSVINNSLMLRKLIILKEANSIGFLDLYERYRRYLFEKNEAGEKVYQEMYLSFIQFDDYFQTHPA